MTNAALTVAPLTNPSAGNAERFHYSINFKGWHFATGWAFGKTPEAAAEKAMSKAIRNAKADKGLTFVPADANYIYLTQG